jgi:signal transduction histidine kinase
MANDTNAVPESDALVRFAKRVSHDINNFSTVVRTYSELLLSDVPESDPMHADIAEIHRAADATVQYLQRVTQFSRASNMRRLPTLVDDGIADAQAMLATELGDRAVIVTLGGGQIQADASWWRNVVIELLRNAHDAAPAGSAIIVRSAVQDATVIVDIEDEGEGVPADLLETVTEPFVTSKQGVRGAGIGLAIVAAFVHTLGGSIQFDRIDTTAGARTRVRLTLPA